MSFIIVKNCLFNTLKIICNHMHITRTMFSTEKRFLVGKSMDVIFSMVETFGGEKAVGIFPRFQEFPGGIFKGDFLRRRVIPP